MRKKGNLFHLKIMGALVLLTLLLGGCSFLEETDVSTKISTSEIPPYEGFSWVELNDNVPEFSESELTTESYESYSSLDWLGRCGPATASLGQDLMPEGERESIGMVKPSGWQTIRYDDLIEDKYLYNRCHLIGFQLSGENANECNLITGTRSMNVDGMLPWENQVAGYIRGTGNHVAYRVTPVFEGNNLVASGVIMEAMSIEDEGKGICFNVYVYNVQPGIDIDYSDGTSKKSQLVETNNEGDATYILNTNSMKVHMPDCSSVDDMVEKNKDEFTGSYETLLQHGYEPCMRCNPS